MSVGVQDYPKSAAGHFPQQAHLMEYAIEKAFASFYCNT
jgi:hypothetical protein